MRLRASERASANAFNYSLRCGGTSCRKTSVFSYLSSGVGLPAKFALAATLCWFEKVEKKGKLVPLRFEFLSYEPGKSQFFRVFISILTRSNHTAEFFAWFKDSNWSEIEILVGLKLSETLFIQRLSLYLHSFSSVPQFLKDTVKWTMHFSSSKPVLILHLPPVILWIKIILHWTWTVISRHVCISVGKNFVFSKVDVLYFLQTSQH